jgi:group I intron endonuclease
MDIIGHIYKITNPTGRIYIGKTTNLKSRLACYRHPSKRLEKQRIISNSINKYGWESHIFEIIDTAPVDKLNELEIHYIKEYNSYYHYNKQIGMNLTHGGEGTHGAKHSNKSRAQIAKFRTGTKHTDETKAKMRQAKLGTVGNFTGCKVTDETKLKISQANKGKLPSQQTIENRNNTRLKKLLDKHISILQIDPNTQLLIKEWKALPKTIAIELNLDDVAILKCLKNKFKTGGGFIWKYKV